MSSVPGDAGSAPAAGPYGEIFDRGYQHYQGRREGRAHAVRALTLYSMRRALGVKKRWTAKIIPIFLYAAAFVPVVTIIGVRALVTQVSAQLAEGFNYSFLAAAISPLLLIYAAAAAPEMLCDDRRENVLPLYFSRAITRVDYLLAKVLALGLLMGSIAIVPLLVLFVGNTLLADAPLTYLRQHPGDIGRILITGTLLSVYYAAIGLVIAAFTARKGVAAALYIGFITIETGVVEALSLAVSGAWKDYLDLFSLGNVPDRIVQWLLGPASGAGSAPVGAPLQGWTYLFTVAAVVTVCGVVMHRRYLAEE
ncbi:MAG: hypothetical protein QJR03_08695 [Sphaerobacter sp.]|nr:hypothetical protein [Sphaerobacter sp.]